MLFNDGLTINSISWLFAAMKLSKRRFAIKCSAAMISHNQMEDLIARHQSSATEPSTLTPCSSATLTSTPKHCISSHCTSTNCKSSQTKTNKDQHDNLLNQLKLVSCVSPKKAVCHLDIAYNNYKINNNYQSHNENISSAINSSSSFLFTLHLYQYHIKRNSSGKNTGN